MAGILEIDSWDQFKERFKEACKEESLEEITKYKDEKWNKFLKRMIDWMVLRKIEDAVIIEKLRQIKIPKQFIPIIYNPRMSLIEMTEVIKEMEEFEGGEHTSATRNKNEDKREIKCFRCGKKGHIKRDCRVKITDEINTMKEKHVKVDERNAKINSLPYKVLFNMGQSLNNW